ncbi:hypothetical protein BDW60DRAFT_211546 [Aspergillus nidulans var. acristatus]|jgi:hypothetical protein
MRPNSILYPALLHSSTTLAVPDILAASFNTVANSQTVSDFISNLPYSNCIRLGNFVYNYDTTPLLDLWYDRVCSTGCMPSVHAYQSQARALALPIIETEAANMDTTDLTDVYVTMMDRGYKWALETCGAADLPDGGNLCADRERGLAQMAECGRENGWRLAVGNLRYLWRFLDDETCRKHLEYVSDPSWLQERIPGYLELFRSAMC